jgi:hypothetical protein
VFGVVGSRKGVRDMEFTELVVFERKRVGSNTGGTASPDCIKISLSKEKGEVYQINIRIGCEESWLGKKLLSVNTYLMAENACCLGLTARVTRCLRHKAAKVKASAFNAR